MLAAALGLPNRVTLVANTLPVVRLLLQPDEQYRLHLGEVPYDLLRAADAALPRDATVLLVTPGRDTGTLEYITYHRALYFLAPRPVWWAAPTATDGTWKSRWWVSTPLTSEALRAVAAEKGASYMLVFGVPEVLPFGRPVLVVGDGYLSHLDAQPPGPPPPATSTYASPLWPLGILMAVAVPLLLGGLVLRLAARLGYRAVGVEALSLAWSLGAGLLTLLMLYLNALGLNLAWHMAAGVAVGALALLPVGRAMFSRWRTARADSRPVWVGTGNKRGAHFGGPSSRVRSYLAGVVQCLVLALLALQAVLVAIPALGRPLDVWDSWVNWGVKSRAIFLEGHISPAVYADPSRAVTHLDYPLLVPLLQSWFYGWVGAPDDRIAGVASVLFYLALLGICYAAVRARAGSRLLALATATTVGTVSHVAGLASIVFAEMPLAVFATVTGVYLLKWLHGGTYGALLISAVGAGLLCWTKRDGVLFLAALLPAAVLVGWRQRRAWQGVGALAVGALLVSGPWYAFAAANSLPTPDFQPASLGTLAANLGRWSTIVELEWNSLTSQSWSYIWPLAALVGLVYWVAGWRRGRGDALPMNWRAGKWRSLLRRLGHMGVVSEGDFATSQPVASATGLSEPAERFHSPRHRDAWAALVPITAVLHIVLSGGVYFFSAFVPLEQHVLASIDRLLVQVAPLVVLWVDFLALPVPAGGQDPSKLSSE
ncbi:MAG TPA: hypothetical protein VF914_17820 [Chloroflexia bacterium]